MIAAFAPNPTEAWRGIQTEHIIIAIYPLVRKQNLVRALAACKTLGIQQASKQAERKARLYACRGSRKTLLDSHMHE